MILFFNGYQFILSGLVKTWLHANELKWDSKRRRKGLHGLPVFTLFAAETGLKLGFSPMKFVQEASFWTRYKLLIIAGDFCAWRLHWCVKWSMIYSLITIRIDLWRTFAILTVGCVFPMVIWSEFHMGKCRNNDHREDVPHFTVKMVKVRQRSIRILISG